LDDLACREQRGQTPLAAKADAIRGWGILGGSVAMLVKPLVKTGILAAAIGTPCVMFNDGVNEFVRDKWNSVSGSSESSHTAAPPDEILRDAQIRTASMAGDGSQAGAAESGPTLTGPPAENFLSVLRFDISPEWVASRWSQVPTVLSDTNMQGLRVPLVTGHELDDLAGSLTYYFDKHDQVQRVAFEGSTGDPRKLIAETSQFYGFQEEPALGAGLYLIKWNGSPTSLLRIRYASVIRASSPNSRYEVRLEINRPAKEYGLSNEALAMLREDRATKHW
jgi:hypothetical protein